MYSLLHVSVHPDHPQGAYGDPCWSYAFVELSVKYIVTCDDVFYIEWLSDGLIPLSTKAVNITYRKDIDWLC
jgi:hypothetical protein